MSKSIDWLYHRNSCTTCKKAEAYREEAGTAVKEAGKAVAETTKQGVENAQAATTSKEPDKTLHTIKAKVHKTKAAHAANASKAAASEAIK